MYLVGFHWLHENHVSALVGTLTRLDEEYCSIFNQCRPWKRNFKILNQSHFLDVTIENIAISTAMFFLMHHMRECTAIAYLSTTYREGPPSVVIAKLR